MFQKGDEAHIKATDEMQKPEAMKEWFGLKRKEFEGLPEDGN